ncbi:hypothetical protein [Vibrio toranzoniae]|uniref:hypothetical protein n=1 Tax=Vibrio toranzoniae TaxID=1194427 RepID=UPI001929BA45|nr:hypothetical protein [Vibrio toranzoniae]
MTSTQTTTVNSAVSSDKAISNTQEKLQALKDRVAANTIATSQPALTQAKVGESANPYMIFNITYEDAKIHWLDTVEKKGYVHCNDDGCPLCQAGNKAYNRLLLPVFNLSSRQVEVLAITDSGHPKAALPQILPVFDAVEPMMMLMSRQRNNYNVDLKPLPKNIDLGQSVIETFNNAYTSGQIKLSDVYEKCSNQELAAIPSIQVMLQCYGYTAA